jgi:ABC-type glycerol-3-phosphate transport system substrate-binding protein
MRWSRRLIVALVAVLLLLGAVAPLALLRAQSTTVTISVAVPAFSRDAISDKLLAEFEAAHPGVKVNVIGNTPNIPQAALGIDKHLEEMQKYVSSADVLFVDSTRITPEATRAGYYLDLAPLVDEDKTLNISDFQPTIWQAFQWEKGIWGLPTSSDVLIMTYQPAAFDRAGLAYPNEQWTIGDLDNAIRKLAQKDADGKVSVHGIDVFTGYSDVMLFRSLLGEGLYDSSTIPNSPQISKPGVEPILDAWYKIDKDGLIGNDVNKAPLSVSPIFALLAQPDTEQRRVGVLLPGGRAGLDTEGFAVSAGTQYPEQAYALANFLTTKAEVGNRFNATPARKSLVGVRPDGGLGINLNIPAAVQQLIDRAVANGFSVSELRYAGYMAVALNKMKTENLDAKSALVAAELQATKDQQVAAEKRGKATVAVATPVPVGELTNGKIELKFGLVSFVNPLPQQDKWNKLIADFTASDPQVGRVTLNTGFAQLDKLAEQNDCFYLPYNAVPNVSLNLLLNLDPFIAADSSFDKNDLIGNIMTQVQRDNKVWALPITVEPSILKYDSERFGKAGAVAPVSGWTIDAFKDAVKALKIDPKDPPPFVAPNTGGAHLLLLIAAYGALPLDYRTDPPTINFTDPATVDAIRQVLDLAKNGYIKYDALGSLTGGFSFGGKIDAPIYTDSLSLFSFRRAGSADQPPDTYKPTTYPKGNTYTAISYGITTAYISAASKNPEACYRWISTITKHPDLFTAMPARRTQIDDPGLAQLQGADVIALYKVIDGLLKDPNTLSIPSQFSGGASPTGFLLQHWLYEAFDKYVLHDGDLDAALKEAETMSKGFQQCAVNLPPLDASSQEKAKEYIKAFGDCAVKVDPRLKPLFDLIK